MDDPCPPMGVTDCSAGCLYELVCTATTETVLFFSNSISLKNRTLPASTNLLVPTIRSDSGLARHCYLASDLRPRAHR